MHRNGIILSAEPDESKPHDVTSSKALQNTVMQLRKICCHPFLFDVVEADMRRHLAAIEGPEDAFLHINTVELWRTSGKFELLDRMLPKLRAGQHRSLLFSQFTTVLNILEDYFRYKKIKYCRMDGKCLHHVLLPPQVPAHTVPGSTKASDRGEMLKVFNAPDSELEIFILR